MKRSFFPLFATNFFGVVNDNFLKTLASFVVLGWLGNERMHSVFMGATAAALVLPYILCSPLADRLTVVFEKRKILLLAKWSEIPIVLVAVAGFHLESPAILVAAILLMGLQSSLYSPAKYALVRDVGGVDRVSTGMGGMEGVTFAAVLGGTILASFAVGNVRGEVCDLLLLGFAALGLVFSRTIRADEEKSRQIHAVNPVRYLVRAYRLARRTKGLNAIIFTLSVFWWAAAMLQQGLLVYGKQVLRLDSAHTGLLLALAAVGIVAGQVAAGFADRRRFLLGATPITGLIASALLGFLFFARPGPVGFGVALALLAFDLGFFKLPFDSEIQRVAKGAKLNTMLAYFNQTSFLFMFFASLCYVAVSWLFGPRAFLALLAFAFAAASAAFALSYPRVLVRAGRWILRRRYDVRVEGLDEILARQKSKLLVLPNHPAMIDPMLVMAEFFRAPLRPLVDELFFRTGRLAPHVLKTVDAVKVPDLRARRSKAGAAAARALTGVVLDALADGGNVLFYPSGHVYAENREDVGTRQLAHNVCRELPDGVRVLGVRTTGLWGSIWSRAGRAKSPAFAPTLAKSVFLWFFASPFKRRRAVTMHVEDLTDRVREWSALPRLEFNARLTAWYNGA
ncbi:MAG: MFS transporter [Kiritimatiellae bacterium]|nr:MFS transporter [Kiritimatiellia bacterium]